MSEPIDTAELRRIVEAIPDEIEMAALDGIGIEFRSIYNGIVLHPKKKYLQAIIDLCMMRTDIADEIDRLRAQLAARDRDWEVQSKTLSEMLDECKNLRSIYSRVGWVCCCGAPLNGSHDHNTCGPPEPVDGEFNELRQQLAAANAMADRLAEALRSRHLFCQSDHEVDICQPATPDCKWCVAEKQLLAAYDASKTKTPSVT